MEKTINKAKQNPPPPPPPPYYESCKDVDISSLNQEETEGKKSTEATFCFNCEKEKISSDFKEIKKINLPYQEKAFKEQLQKRAVGATIAKLEQTRLFRACIIFYRPFFDKRKKWISWWRQKEECENLNKGLISSIKEYWPKLRRHLALSQPSLRENRILSDRATWMDATPSHFSFKFNRPTPLSSAEKKEVEKIYVDHIAQIPEGISGGLTEEEFRDRLYNGFPTLFSDEATLNEREKFKIKEAIEELRRESKAAYFEILDEMPVLGFLKEVDPDEKEITRAFADMESHLRKQLKELQNPKVSMGMLLPFKSLVEGLLAENKNYCLAAEKARMELTRKENREDAILMASSLILGLPCLAATPVCLGAGTVVGAVGITRLRHEREKSFGRFLTGKEFETMAGLSEKERELFLEQVFFPLGEWGTLAVVAKATKRGFTNLLRASKGKGSGANASRFQQRLAQIEQRREKTRQLREQARDKGKKESARYLKGLIRSRKLEASEIPDIEISEESLSRFTHEHELPLSKLERRRLRLYHHDFSFKAGLKFANENLQYVIKNSNGAQLYHGSDARSLQALSKSGSGLKPTSNTSFGRWRRILIYR